MSFLSLINLFHPLLCWVVFHKYLFFLLFSLLAFMLISIDFFAFFISFLFHPFCISSLSFSFFSLSPYLTFFSIALLFSLCSYVITISRAIAKEIANPVKFSYLLYGSSCGNGKFIPNYLHATQNVRIFVWKA